jgi:thiamine pyrophosphokinase
MDVSCITHAYALIESHRVQNTALIVLNTTALDSKIFEIVWKQSSIHIAADGGAKALYNFDRQKIPTFICGDFDSISNEILNYFQEKQVDIFKISDQSTTDLEKCLTKLSERSNVSNMKYNVIIYGGLGGRFDHEMQNINCLYKYRQHFLKMCVVSPVCVVSLVPAGEHMIEVWKEMEGPTCGLIPIGGPVSSLTTRGLQWDVTDWKSQFGGEISSSNSVSSYCHDENSKAIVHIKNSEHVLWTVTLSEESH